jgi:GTP cyclohydrolase II
VQRPLPTASIRTEVAVPLRLADGYSVPARVFSFDGLVDGREHLAFALGDRAEPPLVRLHSECLTGDVFGSQRCDCGPQLREAVEHITDSGGYLLYLRQEGRGIGLYAGLGVSRVDLLSNNPDKARQLREFGVTVAERVPTGVHLSTGNARYLETKARRGHTLELTSRTR